MTGELDPEAERMLELADRLPLPPTYALSVESARKRVLEFFGNQPMEDVAHIEDFVIPGPAGVDAGGGIPVRVYEPAEDPPHPVLVYYHGGGWTTGGIETHDNVCAGLTNRAGCVTVSVEYRLAPEHPFPAGLEDAYAAVEWVAAHAGRIHGDPDRVAVAGDSAGGNLSAAVTLLTRDHDGPALVHQALIYPALASPVAHEFPSHHENATGYLLETSSMEWYYDRYLQSPVHARNPYAAPLLADDFSGLPPATIVTAGFDPLRDEAIEYADGLANDGVDVDHQHYPGMIHGFVSFPERITTGHDALDTLGSNLSSAFGVE